MELYEPFIKSLIELDIEVPSIEFSREIDNILKNLYSVYKFDNNFEFSIENTFKKIITFSNLAVYQQLLGLLSYSTLIKSKTNKVGFQYFFNSNFSSPIVFTLKKNLYPANSSFDSLVYNINYKIGSSTFVSDEFKDLLPPKKIDLYHIRSSFFNDNYDSCLSLIEEFLSKHSYKSIDSHELFNIKYICYLRKDELNSALLLLGEQLINNNSICSQIDHDL